MLVSFPTDKCPFHLKSFKIPQVNLKKKKNGIGLSEEIDTAILIQF